MAAFGLAYAVRFYSGIPVWKGIPPFEWYVTPAARGWARWCRSPITCRDSIACGAADRAWTISLPSSSAARSRSSSASSALSITARTTSRDALKRRGRLRGRRSCVWLIFLVINVHAHLHLARGRPRGAGPTLEGGHRAQARADCRRGRSRPPRRRQAARTSGARVQGRRLPRRSRGRSHRLSRPAAARHAGRSRRDHAPGEDRSPLRDRCRSKST